LEESYILLRVEASQAFKPASLQAFLPQESPMSRDHRKLRAFELADDLVLRVYRTTKAFPREELFGLTSQMRRASVSVAANIVEGCARKNHGEYVQFLNTAFASLREVGYYIDLTQRLGLLSQDAGQPLSEHHAETARVLAALLRSLSQASKPSSLQA